MPMMRTSCLPFIKHVRCSCVACRQLAPHGALLVTAALVSGFVFLHSACGHSQLLSTCMRQAADDTALRVVSCCTEHLPKLGKEAGLVGAVQDTRRSISHTGGQTN